MIGTRLGPYEITAKLGEGGMGEVYRATDRKLRREVAIKVLPAAFTADHERLERFEREAHVLASLNHPNIGAIYGLEESGGVRALVMELVEGPTLADRLDEGPFPIDESVAVALQLAQALEEAHEKGIVHRDLKPQNIKVSREGKVKVLDFGLAKAMQPPHSLLSRAELEHSPTVTMGGTLEGAILGTAAYMAPEQARGDVVDKRADIWAFGVVLYEMLTGERLFVERSVVDTLSAVMRKEIDHSRLPATTPRPLRELLRRCLERNPKNRLHDIGDARLGLEELLSGKGEGTEAPLAPVVPVPARSRWLAPVLASVVGLALGAFLFGRWSDRTVASDAGSARALRAAIPLPPGLDLDGVGGPVIALSPDGSTLAFLARAKGEPQRLYVRRLGAEAAQAVPGSETAEGPFFSPDGRWVAFAVGVSLVAGGVPAELRKHSLDSGLTQTICRVRDYFGGLWRQDGTILFVNTATGGLWSVPSSGGVPEPLFRVFRSAGRETEKDVTLSGLLPGGSVVLLADYDRSMTGDLIAVEVATGEVHALGLAGSGAQFVPSGHLVYGGADGALQAVRFDPVAVRVVGAPVAVVADLAFSRYSLPAFAVGGDGTLVYATGYLRFSRREPMRVIRATRRGEFSPSPAASDLYGRPFVVSPDGRRLAMTSWDGLRLIVDLERGTRIKLPRAGLLDVFSLRWTADGRSILLAGTPPRGERALDGLFLQAVDGAGAVEPLGVEAEDLSIAGYTPDGRTLVYEHNEGTDFVSTIVARERDGASRKIWVDEGGIGRVALSPDGRWVAFDAEAGAQFEIYAVPVAGGGRVAITAGGGRWAAWSHDGREIYFQRQSAIWAVEVRPDPSAGLRVGAETELFDWPDVSAWDVAPDGAFYGTEPVPGAAVQTSLQLRTGWLDDIDRLAGRDQRR